VGFGSKDFFLLQNSLHDDSTILLRIDVDIRGGVHKFSLHGAISRVRGPMRHGHRQRKPLTTAAHPKSHTLTCACTHSHTLTHSHVHPHSHTDTNTPSRAHTHAHAHPHIPPPNGEICDTRSLSRTHKRCTTRIPTVTTLAQT